MTHTNWRAKAEAEGTEVKKLRMALIKGGSYDPDPGDSIRLHRHDDTGRESHKVRTLEVSENGDRWIDIPAGFSNGDDVYLLQTKATAFEEAMDKIDLHRILMDMSGVEREKQTFQPELVYDFKLSQTKDESVLLQSKKILASIEKETPSEISLEITNTDRTFGTLLGAEITRKHAEGLAEDTIQIHCNGSGGQSFGAFIPKGLTLDITGDANDYLGKGLSGGKLIVKAPKEAKYDPSENVIIGNVALYGATSGEAYIAGMAGERFCIRNSGAVAVVEGVGEHGCEYMTGGCVVILGPTGKNFAAGMSGGVAYVLDEGNKLYRNLNKQLVSMENLEQKADKEELHRLLEKHVQMTGSEKGRKVLEHFEEYVPHFKKIIPMDYKEILRLIAKNEEQGMSREQAQLEAFEALHQ